MHSIFEILEESTDATAVDLISLDDLKLALGITTDTDDEALQAAITFQSRIIAEYCDRRLAFAEAMETFTFDRNEVMLTRQALWLSLYPVAQIFETDEIDGRWVRRLFEDFKDRMHYLNLIGSGLRSCLLSGR
jgi:hypothetical protein